MPEQKETIKHVPKAHANKPMVISIDIEVPSPTSIRLQDNLRQEIAYLQYLMRKYPGPTERFYNEAKST